MKLLRVKHVVALHEVRHPLAIDVLLMNFLLICFEQSHFVHVAFGFHNVSLESTNHLQVNVDRVLDQSDARFQ